MKRDDTTAWGQITPALSNIHNWFASDDAFNNLYPPYIKELAKSHWTPVEVARKASNFLAAMPGDKILDIGSGPGKFCLSGAYYNPEVSFYGIEQRDDLVYCAAITKEMLGLNNVTFLNGNLLDLDFSQFDHFYFFNSFYENLPGTDKIDNNLTYSRQLYNKYNRFLYKQLENRPPGTRLVTYHGSEEEAPKGYQLAGSTNSQLLKCWIKAAY
ncbi:methyltransferase domain-containing protein [Chitinophaga sp. SYP-B3965]|uniref:methyltransferase domain-containing protein n=1 Tax=Chitinophaga sp. SYP-B3965 TaxID=2663120 RepID=UPI0012996744|nr:methyltransferase domain-containing protein [Chitinophaga sp. SYP-B3965]MRG48447.1 methyltransferase domain-containing protein [Chitinophaga sp. SYP-B3965]